MSAADQSTAAVLRRRYKDLRESEEFNEEYCRVFTRAADELAALTAQNAQLMEVLINLVHHCERLGPLAASLPNDFPRAPGTSLDAFLKARAALASAGGA